MSNSSSTLSTKTAPAVKPLAGEKLHVPLADLKAQYAQVGAEITEELRSVMESSAFILGPKVARFEMDFAKYVGSKHCVGVSSGTAALHLALICAGVGYGDEVITVPMTFIATSWAISYVGAKPVFVDIDPVTCTLDVAQVEKHITPKTKAILPVHLYGQPADMAALMEIGRRRGIPVIEDAAQAHGAKFRGLGAGSIGQTGCFSFYPGKNLGAYGEAGAVVTDDDAIAARLRALRDHAQDKRYYHKEIGFNYRMDGFQGAVLGVKLRYLEDWTRRRALLANRYRQLLDGLPLQLPTEAADRRHVWHLFVVLHPQRDRLQRELDARGISTGLHYPVPLHLQQAYRHLGYEAGAFPVAERVANECLTLPLFAEMTIEQQGAVVEALTDILKEGN
jgi:dTDP-4-amino-4,6-dideoxygalactose transaminase